MEHRSFSQLNAVFNKTESPIFVLLCVFCLQRQPFRFSFYLTIASVKCRVGAVKRLITKTSLVKYTEHFTAKK